MSETGSTNPKDSTAAVHGGVVPYLAIDGALKAADFYVAAFGAEIIMSMPPDERGRTMHVHLHVNGNSVMLSDPYPEHGMPFQPHQGYHLMLQVDDIAGWWERALAAGATALQPPQDMFWGARHAMLRDPFGVHWALNQPLS